jgi:hypothetical protein
LTFFFRLFFLDKTQEKYFWVLYAKKNMFLLENVSILKNLKIKIKISVLQEGFARSALVLTIVGIGVFVPFFCRYLLVLDRTNWRTNLLTALLVPYVALNLPEFLFGYLRSDIGRWIAFIAVVIRLFFAPYFPNLIHGI